MNLPGPLAKIFVSSITKSEMAEDCRVTNVVPLYKKGCQEEPRNYRPVSLMSEVGKLFEGFLRDMIYLYLERQEQKTNFLVNIL